MALEYVNRRGDRHYVLQGKTKTGKPKYYCSKKPEGVAVEQLPDGFEIHENPENALVSVRKLRPTRIHLFERKMLANWVAELIATELALVEVEGDSLVVYSSDADPDSTIRILDMLVGPVGDDGASHRDWIVRHARYSPCFRFSLTDEAERLYLAERRYYMGSREGWHLLASNQSLESLARQFLPHVGQESFFELI